MLEGFWSFNIEVWLLYYVTQTSSEDKSACIVSCNVVVGLVAKSGKNQAIKKHIHLPTTFLVDYLV